MLRRWIDELGSALGAGDVDLAENVDPKILDMTFASLLGRMASQRRVVVLIDALDQFKKTARGRFATCLPRPWPANARLVATAIAGGASKVLAERPGVEALSLPPLDAAEARGIIEGIGDRHQRKLEPPVIDALLAKKHAGEPASGNPLWLVLAVEELNLLDADDLARLRKSMLDSVEAMPADILRLYRATFDRAAELFGAATVQAFLGLIVVSRAGWRESDFRRLLPLVSGEPWDEQRFAALRRLLRGQMSPRGDLAQWDFNHVQMRAAARSRLAALRLSEPQLHLLIADHLLTLASDDPLRATETMVHLLASKDDMRAVRYYGDSSLSEAETQGATRALADAIIAPAAGTAASAARDLGRLLDTADDSVCALLAERFLFNLGDAVEHHAALDARLIVLNSIEQAFQRLLRTDPGNAGWQRDLAALHDRVGDVLMAQGNLPEALKSFRDALAIRDRLVRGDPGNAGRQRDLSMSYEKVGGVLVAQGNLPEALKSVRDGLATRDRLAQHRPRQRRLAARSVDVARNGWRRPDGTGRPARGPEILPRPARDCQTAGTRRLRQRRLATRPVGVLRSCWRRPGGAGQSVRGAGILPRRDWRSESGWRRTTPTTPAGSAVCRCRTIVSATCWWRRVICPRRLKSFREQLAIADRLARADPDNAAWQRDLSVSHDRIGDVLVAQSKLPEALKSFRDALAIRDRLARSDPDNADWQRGLAVSYDRVGDVLMSQGDLNAALKSFRDQLAIAEGWRAPIPATPAGSAICRCRTKRSVTSWRTQGNLPEALKSFRDGLAIRDRLARADPGNVGWQRGLSVSYDCVGDVLVAQGNLPEALKSFRDGLAIRDRLARSDPGNAGWQRDLSVSYDRIGGVLEAQGNLPEALKSFHEGVAIADRLARAHPGDADWQRGLAVSNAHLADVYRRSDDPDNALAALRQGQSVMKKVVKLSPDHAGWKKDLDWFNEQIASLTK